MFQLIIDETYSKCETLQVISNPLSSKLCHYRSVYTERDHDRGLAALAKKWSKQNKLKLFIQSAKANVEYNFSLYYLD